MTRASWSTPAKTGGWPTFDATGKIVRETRNESALELCRSPFSTVCVKNCGEKCGWAV